MLTRIYTKESGREFNVINVNQNIHKGIGEGIQCDVNQNIHKGIGEGIQCDEC